MNKIKQLFLKIILWQLERQINVNSYDRELSRQIDAVRFLLEN